MAKEKPGVTITGEGEFGVESQYVAKPEAEIRQLALDVLAGQVFGTWSLRESDMSSVGMIFMPIMLMGDIQRKALQRDKIVHFYGHMRDSTGTCATASSGRSTGCRCSTPFTC